MANGVVWQDSWSTRMTFFMAASGSAVGLGNIWRFPYTAGEYGGGAFVSVYLLCIAAIGLPIMAAGFRAARFQSARRNLDLFMPPGIKVSVSLMAM